MPQDSSNPDPYDENEAALLGGDQPISDPRLEELRKMISTVMLDCHTSIFIGKHKLERSLAPSRLVRGEVKEPSEEIAKDLETMKKNLELVKVLAQNAMSQIDKALAQKKKPAPELIVTPPPVTKSSRVRFSKISFLVKRLRRLFQL